ncbi:MAG TPA: protein kinase, partial [Gemmatimonadaceae bacterium]|nr:protein kinase [Gemmatimonadaceae bacterium]
DYAHREGVIHRDVKPANIMVDQKGSSIVMDFGIARAAEGEHFTQTGATIGTPAYMSPEQCHGHEISAASDQYSLGVVAYELLTGHPPFTGTPIELQIAHMQDTPVPVGHRRSDIPDDLANAVMRMLEKKPENRWPSLRELSPVFSRGLDTTGGDARNTLIEMVRAGAPRGHSFAATPISPAPFGAAPRAPAPADRRGDAASASSAEREAPTKISAPHPLVGVVTPAAELMAAAAGALAGESPSGGALTGTRAKRTLAIAATVIVAAGLGTLALRGGKRDGAASRLPSASPAGTPALADQVAQLIGDSAALGPAPLSRGAKTPREVTPDAIALLQLTVPPGRIAAGDTVHLRLQALDDAGLAVTTPQIVWTTSNPRVVRFSGPGQVIAVTSGKATLTVTAGTATTSRDVTVLAARR